MQRWIQRVLAGAMVAGTAGMLYAQTVASQPTAASDNTTPWVRMSTQTTQVGVSPTIQLMNSQDGTTVIFRDVGDNLQIQYQVPKTLDFWDYTVAARELRHGELPPGAKDNFPARIKSLMAANTYDAAAARWKAVLAGNWRDVSPVDDGGAQCYKLAEAISLLQQPVRPGPPISMVPDTVWVDPATKMILKTVKHYAVGAKEWDVTVTYEYNAAPIEDVYGAGVPRDARIVDNRPTKETRAVLDRLEGRIAKGGTDYVGVHVDAPLRLDGSADYSRALVRLLARKGNRGLASTYTAVTRVSSARFGVVLPTDWDNVDLPELITTMRGNVPSMYAWYADGKAELARYMRGRLETYNAPSGDLWTAMQAANIAPLVWPDLASFNRYTPETQMKLLSDDEHKGQVGLQVTRFGPSNDFYLTQAVYWIDPARGDVVMAADSTTFRAGSALNRLETTERRTLELKTMEDGRVYPARWQVVTRRTTGEGFLDPQASRESRLFLLPGKELDSTWVPHVPDDRPER